MHGVAHLAEMIGYPDLPSERDKSCELIVDGHRIRVRDANGGLEVRMDLDANRGRLSELAGFAVGRILNDDVVLAFDDDDGRPFIWNALPMSLSDAELLRGFERFIDACDWWTARVSHDSDSSAWPINGIVP